MGNTAIKSHVVWKEKAKERRLENKILKQRVKEITTSRDSWKDKAKKMNKRSNELGKENINHKNNR